MIDLCLILNFHWKSLIKVNPEEVVWWWRISKACGYFCLLGWLINKSVGNYYCLSNVLAMIVFMPVMMSFKIFLSQSAGLWGNKYWFAGTVIMLLLIFPSSSSKSNVGGNDLFKKHCVFIEYMERETTYRTDDWKWMSIYLCKARSWETVILSTVIGDHIHWHSSVTFQ